jgi:Holliday junction DNA helicase RuvA
LSGTLLSKKANLIVVDVHGVGYELNVPLSTFYLLGDEGTSVSLRVYTYVREDAIALYGFKTAREKEFFEFLLNVTGIGPRLAIGLLSGATVEELAQAIRTNDLHRLTAIPGVGRKTAERMVLELRDKMIKFAAPEALPASLQVLEKAQMKEDLVSALVNLSYPRNSAEKAVSTVLADREQDANFESALKRALKILSQ